MKMGYNLMGKVVSINITEEHVSFFKPVNEDVIVDGMVVGYDTKDGTYLICSHSLQFEEFEGIRPEVGIYKSATHFFIENDEFYEEIEDKEFVYWVSEDDIIGEIENIMSDLVNMDWNEKHPGVEYK